ncbi:MAG: TolC family protein [Mediterranea massiliensis]|nr:TolC family protein [Mediterranea massiliensis]
MNKKNRLVALLTVMLCANFVPAQTQKRIMLSLEDMYSMADKNSQSIKTYRIGKESAHEALKAAKSQRLPDIEASLSVSYLGNGWLGDRDFGNGKNIDMPHVGNNFAIEASQVIYSGGAISSGIRLAELGVKMSELDYLKNQQEIRFLLTGYYLDLYKLSNQEQVLLDNLKLTAQVIKNMEARQNEGTALKNDITRYELQRENLLLQLTKVRDTRKIMNHQLVTTLHLPDETVIQPDTALLHQEVETLTESYWQETATLHNAHLKQAQLGVEISQQQVHLERAAQLPKVALVATNHFDGPITIEVPVINKNFNYWYIGIGMQYNLSSLFKSNKKVKQARLNARRAQEQQGVTEEHINHAVQASHINFLTAFKELNTQVKSVELAQQNYDIIYNRYCNGLSLLTDLLDAGNMKLSAEIGLVNARINVIYHHYKMRYITHTL